MSSFAFSKKGSKPKSKSKGKKRKERYEDVPYLGGGEFSFSKRRVEAPPMMMPPYIPVLPALPPIKAEIHPVYGPHAPVAGEGRVLTDRDIMIYKRDVLGDIYADMPPLERVPYGASTRKRKYASRRKPRSRRGRDSLRRR